LRVFKFFRLKQLHEEQDVLEKEEEEYRAHADRVGTIFVQLGAQIVAEWAEFMEELPKLAYDELIKIEGFAKGLGKIRSLVEPTAAEELLDLGFAIDVAEENFLQLLAHGSTKQIFIARREIDNVIEFAYANAVAADQVEEFGVAARDLVGLMGVELAEATDDAGTSLQFFAGESVQTAAEALANFKDQMIEAWNEISRLRAAGFITPEQADSMVKMVQDVYDLQIATKEAEKAADDLKNSWEDVGATWDNVTDSFGQGFVNWGENLGTMNEQVAQLGEEFAEGLHETIMQFVTDADDASQAWKRFAEAFLTEIASMIIQQMILNVLIAFQTFMKGGAMGGIVEGGTGDLEPLASGGIVSGGLGRTLPVRGYAKGGPIVSGPHVALIGEGQMNEAVVPLPDGKSIPVDMNGGGGTAVSINIQAVDAKGIDELLFQKQDLLANLMQRALREDRGFRGAFTGR